MEGLICLVLFVAALAIILAVQLKNKWQRVVGFIFGFGLAFLATYTYGSFVSRGLPCFEEDVKPGTYEIYAHTGNLFILSKVDDGVEIEDREIRLCVINVLLLSSKKHLKVERFAGKNSFTPF